MDGLFILSWIRKSVELPNQPIQFVKLLEKARQKLCPAVVVGFRVKKWDAAIVVPKRLHQFLKSRVKVLRFSISPQASNCQCGQSM